MSNNIDDLPEGGMGLKIMSELADELSSTRTPDNKNRLLIVKNYEQQDLDQSQALPKKSLLERSIEFFNYRSRLSYNPHQQQLGETPLQKIHLRVNTDLRAVNQVLDWYDQLENLPISKTVLSQCRLALVEGFTNVVRHAHQGLPPETPIELEVTVFNERIEMRIWDNGQPFNLEAKLREMKERDRDGFECEGGRGLAIFLMLADQVTYTRTSDQQNCLLIVKHLLSSSI
jgi:serine/threonine-protein kinase RsbW